MDYKIREIEAKDNKTVEKIIRTCLIEFGANHEGTAWADADLGRFSEIYDKEAHKYWVVENEEGIVLGGVGIGKLTEDVCELQKMYFLQEIRGTGVAHKLMDIALEYAKRYYKKCYIETLSNMIAANKFYKKYGFILLDKPLIQTEHNACDVWYVKDL